MRHKHAENMRLYAEDAEETERPWTRWEHSDFVRGDWIDCVKHPIWDSTTEYRRKAKVIKYRVALMTEGREAWAVSANTEEEMRRISNFANFERWLTDWIEVKV